LDRLFPFFTHFAVSARIFFAGYLCGSSSDHATRSAGHLHVLRKGALNILTTRQHSHRNRCPRQHERAENFFDKYRCRSIQSAS
jgi:hypothetical protein